MLNKKMYLYMLLSIDIGLFLRSYGLCPTRFPRQILLGEIKVLLVADVKTLDFSRYSNLMVRKLYPYIKDMQDINIFFHDYYNPELLERKSMILVLCTIISDEIALFVKDSRQKRSVIKNDGNTELIKIRSSIKNEILTVITQKVIYGFNYAQYKY